jgi:hypothetical protein
MNEQIKELIEQCSETSTSYFDGRGNVTSTYFNKEKFAELIVRGCAQIAMQQQQSHSFDSYDELTEYERGQDDTASTISGQIKQQFGLT